MTLGVFHFQTKKMSPVIQSCIPVPKGGMSLSRSRVLSPSLVSRQTLPAHYALVVIHTLGLSEDLKLPRLGDLCTLSHLQSSTVGRRAPSPCPRNLGRPRPEE